MGKYSISQHAKQRYAERIRNKDEIIEINTFVVQHEDKIKEDINTMIERGEIIFEGKQDYTTNNNIVQVFLKDTWVIIVDPAKHTVVTLYSIDLGLGNEFNIDYISKMKAKISAEKERIKETAERIREQKETYGALIEDNEKVIAEYTAIVKSLKKQNEDYRELLNDLDGNMAVAEVTLRELLGKLIGEKSI